MAEKVIKIFSKVLIKFIIRPVKRKLKFRKMTFKPLTIIGLFFFLLGLQPLSAQINTLERPGTVNSDLQLTKRESKNVIK